MERGPSVGAEIVRDPVFTFHILHSQFRIHAVAWPGPTDVLPLVLLHGVWDTWQTFERVAGRLAVSRRVYALDFRGHGDSDKPDEGYSHADYAGDVLGVLDQLGLDRVALLGHSLGALVATQLVSQAPARVARLALEDPPYGPDVDPRGRRAWVEMLLELKGRPFEEVVEGLSDLNPTRDRATNELSARALMNTADGPFRAIRDSPGTMLDLPGILAHTTQPTVILRGDPDFGGALSAVGRDAILTARPDVTIVEFPTTGHLVHAEREEAFVTAVEAFLAG